VNGGSNPSSRAIPSLYRIDKRFFPIAQLVEQATVNRFVLGSSPSRGASLLIVLLKVGHIGGV
jgi:hypothetical protein